VSMRSGQPSARRIRKLGSAVTIKGKSLIKADLDSSERIGIGKHLCRLDGLRLRIIYAKALIEAAFRTVDRLPGSYPKTGVMSGLATIQPEHARLEHSPENVAVKRLSGFNYLAGWKRCSLLSSLR
jgi:hypothetical protein